MLCTAFDSVLVVAEKIEKIDIYASDQLKKVCFYYFWLVIIIIIIADVVVVTFLGCHTQCNRGTFV